MEKCGEEKICSVSSTNIDEQKKDRLEHIATVDYIIQVSADRLKTDREKCSLISNEIDSILSGQEAKLVKHISHVLFWEAQNGKNADTDLTTESSGVCSEQSSSTISNSSPPTSSSSLSSWLKIVNISPSDAQTVESVANCDLWTLINLEEEQLDSLCTKCGLSAESKRRILVATRNLRKYTKEWIANDKEPSDRFSDSDLSWTSYDRPPSLAVPGASSTSAGTSRVLNPAAGQAGDAEDPNRGSRRSVSESGVDSGASDSGVGSNVSQNSLPTTTPPPSPGYLLVVGAAGNRLTVSGRKFSEGSEWARMVSAAEAAKHLRGITPPASPLTGVPSDQKKTGKASSTPPAAMKWGTSPVRSKQSTDALAELALAREAAALQMTRSHSHEANLQHRILKNPRGAGVPPISEGGGLSPKMPNNLPGAQSRSQMSVGSLGTGYGMGMSASHIGSPDDFGATMGHSSTLHGAVRSPFGYNRNYLSPTSPTPHMTESFSGALGSFGPPPKSPQSQTRLMHSIPHQFRKKFLPTATCFICQKQLGVRGEKCRSCKVKVHTDCRPRLGNDTCGLTKDHARAIIQLFLNPTAEGAMSNSQSAGHLSGFPIHASGLYEAGHGGSMPPGFHEGYHESSSSTGSSTPGTPAPGTHPSPFVMHGVPMKKFTYPGLPEVEVTESEPNTDRSALIGSQESDMTLKSMGSGIGTGSEQTLSQEGLTDSMGSGELDHSGSVSSTNGRQPLKRDLMGSTIRGGSSWQDVTIKLDKIKMGEEIGRGLFGVVKRGYYYMDVAVKFLNMKHVESEDQLEAFKQEVAPFKNTRHENVILLIGYCLEPPNLGIVMNYCAGKTLHTILYGGREKDRPDMNKVLSIAAQVIQGMSYLHGKHILHKDLRTKNIFLENNKVVITDFGLFSVKRLVKLQNDQECTGLHVPDHWLCYLSPEIIRSLVALKMGGQIHELPFSFASDVYAFGTVWYELLTCEFPFKKYPPEAIVWQVGRGIKPALNNIQAAKEIKDIMLLCWTFQAYGRPEFSELGKMFEKLPRKRLARSPSHPVHLSRSHESMF